MSKLEKIAVIGAGTMGHGIAETFAMHGYTVKVCEAIESVQNKARDSITQELELQVDMGRLSAAELDQIQSRISFTKTLSEAVGHADLVIEAIPENLVLKQTLFAELDALCGPETILASNTSSLDLFKMTENLPAERVKNCLICHWYNPAHLMPLVELSDFGNMPTERLLLVETLLQDCGKKTIRVLKNIPGLIANRIQQGVAREVFALIEAGAASAEDIDNALKFGPAFRYATTGQLEVADFGGLDIWCAVGDNLLPEISAEQQASNLLRQKIAENKLGVKTGEGFFLYEKGQSLALSKAFHKRLIRQLAIIEQD